VSAEKLRACSGISVVIAAVMESPVVGFSVFRIGAAEVTFTVWAADPIIILTSIRASCETSSANGFVVCVLNPEALTETLYWPICRNRRL
jgi:hypothetical protein